MRGLERWVSGYKYLQLSFRNGPDAHLMSVTDAPFRAPQTSTSM